jgi:hypothetical protein
MLEKLKNSIDVVYKETKANVVICYHNHLCNILEFMKDFYPILERRMLDDIDDIFPGICKKIEEDIVKIEQMVFSGLLVCRRGNKYYAFDLAKPPTRSPSDSISEAESAFGSRDGFVENIKDNVALIRTRVRDRNLAIDELMIGRRSKTNVSILSISDIHNENIKKEIINTLNKIDIDAILSIDDITAYLQGKNLFPAYQYVGSPDLASRRLYNGELLILIDRISNVLALPTTMALTSRMTIDNINIPLFSIFERSFILIAFLISTSFLGILASFATWQSDSLSLNVLSILKVTQSGVIFPIVIEILAVLVLFELYYFIGFRQSRLTVSSTVVLIGGLIIGENLVTSGVAGILLMTFTAMTYLLTFVVSSNVTIIAAISIIRLGFLISSYYFGLFGVTIAAILCAVLFLKQKSFGVHFFFPFIPFDLNGLTQFFTASSSLKNNIRAKNLKVNNKHRRGNIK